MAETEKTGKVRPGSGSRPAAEDGRAGGGSGYPGGPEGSRPPGKAGGKAGRLRDVWAFLRYNGTSLFAGRATVFVILAVAVFLAVVVAGLIGGKTAFSGERIYDYLLIPGVLLIFYPSAYAIQGDRDAGMVETLFGIPDYRYKVWLVRYFVLYAITAGVLLVLALFCRIGLVDFNVFKMVLQLMFPVIFLGSLAFFLASLTASGISTAILMIAALILIWIGRGALGESSWNVFHNPFKSVDSYTTLVWARTTFLNRMYLVIGSLSLTMLALLRLQRREKFI